MPFVHVTGWASSANIANIPFYNLEGRKVGNRNYASVDVSGAHKYYVDFDLIEIEPDEWVQKKLLITVMCYGQANAAAPGKSDHERAVSMGSGAGCPH